MPSVKGHRASRKKLPKTVLKMTMFEIYQYKYGAIRLAVKIADRRITKRAKDERKGRNRQG